MSATPGVAAAPRPAGGEARTDGSARRWWRRGWVRLVAGVVGVGLLVLATVSAFSSAAAGQNADDPRSRGGYGQCRVGDPAGR